VHQWRVIIDEAADGPWNMAVDRAVLAAHAGGTAPPTLRLYRWDPPTVSLGRFQKTADVDAGYCAANGIGICRRPTGGRGVLHADEVTYSIVVGVRDGLPRGVRDSYRFLSTALAEAYRALGVDAALTARDRGMRSGACYLHATAADLSLGAAKLSGSAQVWDRESCLQHGSFVISRDLAREAGVFALDGDGAGALASAATTISEVLGGRPAEVEIIGAVRGALERMLGIALVEGALSDAELEGASTLRADFAI